MDVKYSRSPCQNSNLCISFSTNHWLRYFWYYDFYTDFCARQWTLQPLHLENLLNMEMFDNISWWLIELYIRMALTVKESNLNHTTPRSIWLMSPSGWHRFTRSHLPSAITFSKIWSCFPLPQLVISLCLFGMLPAGIIVSCCAWVSVIQWLLIIYQ